MDSAFKKLIYWSGHTHSLLGLAVHQPAVMQNSVSYSSLFSYYNTSDDMRIFTCELHGLTSQGQHPEHNPNLSRMVEYR